MTLEPIMAAPWTVQVHLATVVPAMALGIVQFALPKGTPVHRAVGYTYMVLMAITAVVSFFISELSPGNFTWIHLFSVVTLVSLVSALIGARTGNITRHKYSMIGLYLGGIGIAGTLTMLPGRILHTAVFGG